MENIPKHGKLKWMKRKYYSYIEWEDWQNGMYKTVNLWERPILIQKATQLLKNRQLLYNTMRIVTKKWIVSTSQNLSKEFSRRPWLGQAACCYLHKIPEDLTRIAWGLLTEEQRDGANKIADNVINEWVQCQKNI